MSSHNKNTVNTVIVTVSIDKELAKIIEEESYDYRKRKTVKVSPNKKFPSKSAAVNFYLREGMKTRKC